MRRTSTLIFRLSKILALLFAGFLGGRAFGTFDVYRKSRGGDFVDVPPMHLAGIFDIGSVYLSYPGETSISIQRPTGDAPIPSVWFSQHSSAATLSINCYPTRSEQNDATLFSDYNTGVGSKVALWSRGRTVLIDVPMHDKHINLKGEAVGRLIDLMVSAQFPGDILVAPEIGNSALPRGLYDIPAIGIQNVAARINRNGHDEGPIPQPPSDPYRVMQRLCR